MCELKQTCQLFSKTMLKETYKDGWRYSVMHQNLNVITGDYQAQQKTGTSVFHNFAIICTFPYMARKGEVGLACPSQSAITSFIVF